MAASREATVSAKTTFQRFAPGLRRYTGFDRLPALRGVIMSRIPDRFHAVTGEAAKFGLIGLINLGVNFAVFDLLFLTIMSGAEVKAKAIATVVATTCAYFLNRHWTYRNRPKTTLRREYGLFFFFNAVGLVIETSFIWLAKYGLHETGFFALNFFTFLGIGIGTVFRFWAYRTHVFKPESTEDADEVPAGPTPAFALATSAPGIAEPEIAEPADVVAEVDADESLDDELVQLELDEMVDDEIDPARRR